MCDFLWPFLLTWSLFFWLVATQEIWHTIDGVVYDTYTFPLGGRSCVEDANEYKQNTASRKDYAWHKNKLMAVVCVIGVCVGDCVDGKDKISALGLW